MLCSALTTKGVPCKHSATSGCTFQGVDGWIYFLCRQHFTANESGSVTLDKNPARGHAADQPQLDLNQPVQNAWATKETKMKTIKCANCKSTHSSIEEIKECFNSKKITPTTKESNTVQNTTTTKKVQCALCSEGHDSIAEAKEAHSAKLTGYVKGSSNPKPIANPDKLVTVTIGWGKDAQKVQMTRAEAIENAKARAAQANK